MVKADNLEAINGGGCVVCVWGGGGGVGGGFGFRGVVWGWGFAVG